MSCNSDLVQHPNPCSFGCRFAGRRKGAMSLWTLCLFSQTWHKCPSSLTRPATGPRIPIHTYGGISAYGTQPPLQTALQFCTAFQVCTMKSGEAAVNQEDLMMQLMPVAWFRWWWPLVTSGPQPPRGFRTAGRDFFAACCSQP